MNKPNDKSFKVEIKRKSYGGPSAPKDQNSNNGNLLAWKKKEEALRRAAEPQEQIIKKVEDVETQRRIAKFFGDKKSIINLSPPKPRPSPNFQGKSRIQIKPIQPIVPIVQPKSPPKPAIKRFAKPVSSRPRNESPVSRNISKAFLGSVESGQDLPIGQERIRSIASYKRSQEKQKRTKRVDTVVREITVFEGMPLLALAHSMAATVDIVLYKLRALGLQMQKDAKVDLDTACLIVEEFGHKYKKRIQILDTIKEEKGEDTDYQPRAPIVTVVGHVDHGKTSLLDALRSTQVVTKESGGITQSIGASQIQTKKGSFITFIDTPGHEIFTEMRARGVDLTDIVLLIIAADEGIQAQTVESIQHIKSSKAFIIVVFTKIDKPGANIEKIKQMLMRYEIVVQSAHGDVPDIGVSAKSGQNLPELIQLISDYADLLELRANPKPKASGIILEGCMDKYCGPVGTVIVRNGTLRVGDPFLSGKTYGKVRSMVDWLGKPVKEAGPSVAVQVSGFDESPSAGDDFIVIEGAASKEAAGKRKDIQDAANAAISKGEQIYSINDIWNTLCGNKALVELNFIIRCDSYGSSEAIAGAISRISYPNVKLSIILNGVGGVTDTDVTLAKASKAEIIAFRVDLKPTVIKNAQVWGVKVKRYDIIYQILDNIQAEIEHKLAPTEEEVMLGYAEIRAIFEKPKIGKIAGCMVQDGIVKCDVKAVLVRNGVQVYSSSIQSIRHQRDAKHEMKAGQECGIIMSKFSDYKIGDIIQCFEMRKIKEG